ncbi:MAG: S1 RNA-binding domain-containing protein [Candidatus Omnitrophica bacterium]|nr:S1 RNA-binding domain-containing protein [Candidatus Omnitrophota bacterium]
MQEDQFKIGDTLEVEVIKIHNFGAVVKLSQNVRGLIHISQVSDSFVKNINEFLKIGDKVNARIKKISADGKIDLTLKKNIKTVAPNPKPKEKDKPKEPAFGFFGLGEKMEEFLKRAEEENIGS